MRRWVLIVTTALCLVVVSSAGATKGPVFKWQGEEFNTYDSPYNNQYRINGDGNLELFHPEGGEFSEDTPIRTWTPQEWENTKATVEVEAECMGRNDNCVKDIEEGETRLPRGTPPRVIEDGADVVTRTREEAPFGPEPAVAEDMDALGEWGGTLSVDSLISAGTVIGGGLILGPQVFKIGVSIGNKLDQLFGFGQWKWASESSQISGSRKQIEEENTAVFETASSSPPGSRPVSGLYLSGGCNGTEFCSSEEIDSREKRAHISEGSMFEYNTSAPVTSPCGSFPGAQGGCAFGVIVLICEEPVKGAQCEPPPSANEEVDPPTPGGIPVPNTEEIENENQEHEEGPYASRKKVPALPLSPGSTTHPPALPAKGHKREPVLPVGRVAEPIQNETTREVILDPGPKEAEEVKKEQEAVKKLIPEARPGETAPEYKTRLEGLGFTNVTVGEVGEINENPRVGPEGVANVTPTPGSEIDPETAVKISENPKNAPEPESETEKEKRGETGGGVGPPTLPGFKLPEFGVLCKGFPFGVPCWIAEVMSSWSATGKAPVLGIEDWHVDVAGHKKTINATFDFAKLEPIMSRVRPAIVIFGTIGLVLLFFGFAKGGGPPSGSAGEGDSPSDGHGGQDYSGMEGE